MNYGFVRWVAAVLLGVFYRRWQVHGLERVPMSGPLVVCANHHGSLVDPLLLIAGLPRRLRPLAKAPLFEQPLLRPFLTRLGALPVYRPQDRHLVEGSNRSLFAACERALVAGEAILIFPEGLSKPEPLLSPLKPGAARMAVAAEVAHEWTLGVRILPVAIHLEDAERFRRGRVLVEVGDPLEVAASDRADGTTPDQIVDQLTARLTAALRSMLIEMESAEDLDLLRLAVRAWGQERGLRPRNSRELALSRLFAGAARRLASSRADELRSLRTSLKTYSRSLAHFRLSGDELDQTYTLSGVLSYLARRGVLVAVGAPVGLLGALLNEPPLRLTRILADRSSEDADSWASYQMGVAVAAFPLCWLLFALAVGLFAGVPAGLVALIAIPAVSLWSLRFGAIHARFRERVRGFLLLAGEGGLRRHLAAARRDVHDRVEALRRTLEPTVGEASPGDPGTSRQPR